jgi:hypothetical protein
MRGSKDKTFVTGYKVESYYRNKASSESKSFRTQSKYCGTTGIDPGRIDIIRRYSCPANNCENGWHYQILKPTISVAVDVKGVEE